MNPWRQGICRLYLGFPLHRFRVPLQVRHLPLQFLGARKKSPNALATCEGADSYRTSDHPLDCDLKMTVRVNVRTTMPC